MDTTVSTDLNIVAREVGLPIDQVQRTVELLDDGNTVPFITRYRKDETGGLDESKIRDIQTKVDKLRQLNERKQTILKSILTQEKLTEELAAKIRKAPTQKLLEDLYLPFKPKKQTLATQAKQKGLEPLANLIITDDQELGELRQAAEKYVDQEKNLADAEAVLQGVRHIVAENYAENAILRGRLRKLIWKIGVLSSHKIAQPPGSKPQDLEPNPSDQEKTEQIESDKIETTKEVTSSQPEPSKSESGSEQTSVESSAESSTESTSGAEVDSTSAESQETPQAEPDGELGTALGNGTSESKGVDDPDTTSLSNADETTAATPTADTDKQTTNADKPTDKELTPQEIRREKRRKQKERERAKKEKAFKDYFDFREPISKIPPHRVLAINRGDKTQYLKVRIEADLDPITKLAEETVLPESHSQLEFLRQSLKDALSRLIIPSLEREVRRELTEKAEVHAVEVFACNLRKLLLQPPVHNKRVLAIDPGFRSGCKLVVLDQFGNILGQGLMHLIGPDERVAKSRTSLVEMIRKYQVEVVAIGNGTACRDTEELVAQVISSDLKEMDVMYLVVNEAGASVYSTSEIGREEFPELDATVRGTISIGRRLLDPLSELVKINPSNIGVGLYQHDVKSKHLRESLDHVVESCVNYVGVDVNKASPALLSYISGLNQLTARRIYEYRQEHGPFKSREQLKEVPGFGEAAFVQAAGFLKLQSPENALDTTWIHPESYDAALKLLEKLDCQLDQVLSHVTVAIESEKQEAKPEESTPEESTTDTESNTVTEVSASTKGPDENSNKSTPDESQSAVESSPEVTTEVLHSETPPQETAETGTTAEPDNSSEDSAEMEEDSSVITNESSTDSNIEPTLAETSFKLIANPGHKELVEKISGINPAEISKDLEIGEHLATDLLSSLARPGRDPREDFPAPNFRRGVMKLEDLEIGMELSGTVLNVVDFGAFVDIGLHDSGMVHISRLANRYVSDPHEVVSVGDNIKVWVLSIDKERRRVSLTAIEPGTEKEPSKPKAPKSKEKRSKPEGRPQRKKAVHKKSGDKKPSFNKKHSKRPAKPKPVKPITEAVKSGKEPMRSFGELQQLMDLKKEQTKKKKK